MSYLGQDTTGDGTYTLPVEVFPPVITTVPVTAPEPVMMPIPTTLPDMTGQTSGSSSGWILAALVAGWLLVLGSHRKKRKKA